MKKILTYICLVIIVITSYYAQTQQRIPWPSLADSPWPTFRADAQATGRSEFIGPSTNRVLWRKDMPYGILYGPTIGYNETLYFGTRANSQPDLNLLYSVNRDGELNWNFQTGSFFPNYAAPVAAFDSTIYYSTNDGYVYALNFDGTLKWKSDQVGAVGYTFTLSKEGYLYLAVNNDHLIVLDQFDGSIKLDKYIKPKFAESLLTFSPDGNYIYFLNGEPNLSDYEYLVKANLGGEIIWEVHFKNVPLSYPVIDNQGNIYCFGSDFDTGKDAMYSFDAEGNERWKYEVRSFTSHGAPTIDSFGNVIFYTIENVNDDPYEDAISVITSLNKHGELNWEYVVDPDLFISETRIEHGLVCDAEGKIYFGTTHGFGFYCLSADGELLWKIDLEGNEFDSTPVISSDGTLYIGTHLGSLWKQHERNLIAIKDKPNSVEEEELVTEYRLEQNYPNPFNPATTINYSVPKTADVSISIHSLLGEQIALLVNERKSPGSYEVVFDASDLSSGVYFYVMQSGNVTVTKKMMLIR